MAGAFFNSAQSCGPELFNNFVTFLCNSNAPRITIVDKDLRPAGICMKRCGDATDVIAVAHGKERQNGNSSMFSSMEAAVEIQLALFNCICRGEKVPVTVRGAGTGLAVGRAPGRGAIVLSTELMDKVIDTDPGNLTITVQAGSR